MATANISGSATTDEKFTVYIVDVTRDSEQWSVSKRYSEFRDLHEKLVKKFTAKSLPEIPPKKTLGALEPEFVAKRKAALQQYMTELMSRPAVAESDELSIFLTQRRESSEKARELHKEADRSGWLLKQSKWIKEWKRRYIVLRNNEILYFSDPEGEVRGTIRLDGCSITMLDRKNGQDHCFGIFHPKKKAFFLSAETEAEMLDWVRSIEREDQKVGLADFDLMSVVGKGSFGKVIQVRKKDTGQIFAMKVLRKDAVRQRNQVEHTKTERALLQRIRHPFLVDLKFAFQTDDKLYMVLDFVNGGELFSHLKREKRFAEERSRLYASEVLLALEYLHSMDVIYRDLKPENILLDFEGHIRLTDFGLSKMVSDQKATYTFCGTPEYMAPEILMDEGHGKAVDWWSLGILIYELLVGVPPFYSRNKKEMYFKILKCEFRFPTYVTPDARTLLQGLLTRDPNSRLGSGPEDAVVIKSHAWFASMDWDRVLAREAEVTFVPIIKDGETDVTNFDTVFTREKAEISPTDPSRLEEGKDFEGFTFCDKSLLEQDSPPGGRLSELEPNLPDMP